MSEGAPPCLAGSISGFVERNLPSVAKMFQIGNSALRVYDPILKDFVAAGAGTRPTPPLSKPNRTVGLGDIDEAEQQMSPAIIDGLEFKHNSQIGERMGCGTTWKFGNGNPMFGMPGLAFEKTLSIMGGKQLYMVNGSHQPMPNVQIQVGPWNYRDLLKGKIGQTQFVKCSPSSQTIMVNDMDLNQWRVFMLIRKDYWRLKNLDFRTAFTAQVAGGPFKIFGGQSGVQADFATHLKSFQDRDLSVGISGNAQIPACSSWTEMAKSPSILVPLVLGANPYLIFKSKDAGMFAKGDIKTDNYLKLLYDRQQRKLDFGVYCSTSDGPSTSQDIKSKDYLISLGKQMRSELQSWTYSERNSYCVTAKYDIASHMLEYSLGMSTKWFNKRSNAKISLDAKPGDLLPSVLKASLSENLIVSTDNDPESAAPVNTELSVVYDANAGKAPSIGLGFNLDI